MAEEHPEARKLCDRLAERIVDNGWTKPNPPKITPAWLTDARLLLTADKQPFAEVMAVLDWCQSDPFWRKNIRSMSKLRSQYDRLRMDTADAGKLAPASVRLDGPDSARDWLRGEWQAGRTAAIEKRTRMRWPRPDVPLDVRGPDATAEFYRRQAQGWITAQHDAIIARLVGAAT